MKLLVVCVGVFIAGLGCEGSNPRSCIDGTCTDPGLPFCDSDGRFSGTPGVCIAVSCTPNQFDSCRDGKALVCNGQGTSYEMNACPGQCEESAGGCVDCTANDQCPAPRDVCDLATNECVECTASTQCSSPRPVCKVSERECVECVTSSDCMPPKAVCNTAVNQCAVGCTISSQCPASEPFCDTGMMLCRRCERDSECASDLCELSTGQCVAESEITYASPNGSGGACGAKATPCTLTAAWSRMDSTHHIIKLASGTYTTSAALTVPNTAVTVYGYGATVTTTTGITLQLSGAATLRLDGINFINADVNAGFLGGIGSGLTTCSVRLNDVRVDSANTWGL
ncbi:MAG: hypothetical protein JNL83_19925, partial [Myxococcales bacterium]|nr:hypothetical protein [Myxococcales bacterium]